MRLLTTLLLSVTFNLTLVSAELTLEEKVGHLFMIGIYSDKPKEEPLPYFTEYHVAHALIVGKNWEPEQEKSLIAYYQSLVKDPLTIAQDLEWGLNQRLNNVVIFPRNMTLGAIQDQNLIYEMGKEIARECRALGVNFNLSPVADVNNNPLNPVIHMRSFGDDPLRVAAASTAMMKGLKAGGLKTCAKHFPGHGNTSTDSHKGLPIIQAPLESLKKCELIPFMALADAGVDAIMTSHILNPELDPENPATLSKKTLDLIPKNVLILTDDLLMSAIQGDYGDIARKAYLAGADILLFTDNKPHSREAFKKGYESLLNGFKEGSLSIDELDRKIEKILAFKSTLATPSDDEVITESAQILKAKLFEAAVTRVNNIPIEEPIQSLTSLKEPIWGNTLIWAGSPYDLDKLPKDKALIIVYEKEGIESGFKAIKENSYRGRLPIKSWVSENID